MRKSQTERSYKPNKIVFGLSNRTFRFWTLTVVSFPRNAEDKKLAMNRVYNRAPKSGSLLVGFSDRPKSEQFHSDFRDMTSLDHFRFKTFLYLYKTV